MIGLQKSRTRRFAVGIPSLILVTKAKAFHSNCGMLRNDKPMTMQIESIRVSIIRYFFSRPNASKKLSGRRGSKRMGCKIPAVIFALMSKTQVFAAKPGADVSRAEGITEWRDASDPSRATEAFGKDMRVNGWMFFGSSQLADGFGDTSHRSENLPTYVAQMAVAPGARVSRFAGYATVPVSQDKESLAGSLTLEGASDQTELLTIRMGADAPPTLKLAVLTDNLGGPDYAPRGVSLAIDGEPGPMATVTPNGTPDWLIWNLPRLKEGSEISLRVQADKNVATVGGLLFLSPSPDVAQKPVAAGPLPVIDRKIGEFSREGEYLKDYYVFKEADTFHLFYNVGIAGESQQWFEAGNEKAFGHSTSKDFKTWQHHPRVLNAVPKSWEGMVVSAPSIIKHDGTYYMFYTGFDDRVPGKQTIGLATSKDLFHWERHPRNPIYEAPPWADRRADGYIDCRDSHIIKYGDEFLLFTMVSTSKSAGKGAIALAVSKNLIDWEDLGPAVETFKEPESPRVFQHGEYFYMFVSSAYGKQLLRTSNPKKGPWNPIPFRWPAPGLWSGWEVVEDGNRTIFSAFEWKSFGNHIRFWDVSWNDGIPHVDY